jgi:hypothetical protein
MVIEDRFTNGLNPYWRVTEVGGGHVQHQPGQLWLNIPPTPGNRYSNAQISDYGYRVRDFKWRAPLRMAVKARATSNAEQLLGTAGFGFWNQPFVPGTRVSMRLPQAIWFFFSSPPNRMELAYGVEGPGWKAGMIDASRWQFLALAPTAPLGIPLMRLPALYNRLWPLGQRALGVSEKMLDGNLLAESHTYTLDWLPDRASFSVDGVVVHQATTAPRGPLGFVAWLDNQYAIVTPQGNFGYGMIPVEREQALILEYISIETL